MILSWLEPSGTALSLKFAIRQGDQWESPHTVIAKRPFGRYAEEPPWVVLLGDGTLVALWGEERPSGGKWPGSYLYSAVSHDGGFGWSTPQILHTDRSTSEHGFASLAPLNAHRLLAIWLDARDDAAQHRYRLMSAELDASGTVSNEQTVDDDVCTCCPTSLVQAGSGVVAAYRDHTSENIRDIGIARQQDGRWGQPTILHRDSWRINACPVNGPSLAQAGPSLVAVWYTGRNAEPTVKFAISQDAGASFGSPLVLDAGSSESKPVGRAAITALGDRGMLFAWLRQRANTTELLAAVGSRGGTVSSPVVVAQGGKTSLGYPRLQAVGRNAIVSWGGAGDEKEVRTALVSAP